MSETATTVAMPAAATNQQPARSRLEEVLRSGRFVVTAEVSPPDGADPPRVLKDAAKLAPYVDAMNATDASSANVHMSSLSTCLTLLQAGYDPVLQVSCRDRNRIAMQGDVLGAAALGVRNVLCLTGDGVQAGDQPEAKPVFDFDSIQLLNTLRIMRDKGTFLSGRKVSPAPVYFLGAAENPFAPPYEWRPHRLAKKVAAGAQFIQTQYVYDVPRFREFMARVVDMGLHKKVYILAGVGPIRSARIAHFMADNVPGVWIPPEIIKRVEGKEGKEAQAAEGLALTVEIVQQVKEIPGVAGIHVMAYRWEDSVAEIVKRAGIWPRAAEGEKVGVTAQPA
ncbi:MAG: methylenetetrahydrofolate reductase [Anaerolineae bacterium]|nr:methylenetetrahydrofolate reductase [Anaerolineae bacterium]